MDCATQQSDTTQYKSLLNTAEAEGEVTAV